MIISKLIICAAKANDDFTVNIALSDGRHFIFDIKPYLKGEGLKKLRQLAFFKQVKYADDLLYWDDMHDFPLHCMDAFQVLSQPSELSTHSSFWFLSNFYVKIFFEKAF